MAQLEVDRYSSEGISHYSRRQILIAEASDLGLKNFKPLYDNAADRGLALINPLTGNVTEITGWVLKPAPETVRKQPELKDYELRIIND
jgi:hypothetical protein